MKLYLAPSSSLRLIRYLRSTNDGKLDGTPTRRKTFLDPIVTARQLASLDNDADRLISHAEPLEIFVPTREHAGPRLRFTAHLWSGPLPRGAFIDVGHDICVCSPQLLFVLLANEVEQVELIKIGMELCGMYSLWKLPHQPLSFACAQMDEKEGDTTYQLAPATSVKALRGMVERARNLRGTRKARQALRWVLDSSASPMETAVYLLLCLPRRMGGYGLPQPEMNRKITVVRGGEEKNRYADLYWELELRKRGVVRRRGIDVEYQSDYAHGAWNRHKDARRTVRLVEADFAVLPLTKQQVKDVDGFDEFAQSLRRLLGVRSYRQDSEWRYRRMELRRAVFA